MSTQVIITFGTLPSGWCSSSPQDFVNELNSITNAQTEGGDPVKIQFGVFAPGFCPETPEEFIEGLNEVTTGYVMATGASVHVEFGDVTFCWNQPQTVVDALASNYTAYVEGT